MAAFNKILTDTDVKKQVAVESNFMHHLPGCNGGSTVTIQVRDANSENLYEFAYYTRNDGHPHPKPVFQGGLHNYCCDKGLRVGDRITFTVDGGSFTISAERKIIKLFVTVTWNLVE